MASDQAAKKFLAAAIGNLKQFRVEFDAWLRSREAADAARNNRSPQPATPEPQETVYVLVDTAMGAPFLWRIGDPPYFPTPKPPAPAPDSHPMLDSARNGGSWQDAMDSGTGDEEGGSRD